jgi:hypothetical protein
MREEVKHPGEIKGNFIDNFKVRSPNLKVEPIYREVTQYRMSKAKGTIINLKNLDNRRPAKSAMKTHTSKLRENLLDKGTLSPKKTVNFYHV